MEEQSGLKLEKVTDTLNIYQKSGVFSYGTDAVLLSRYVRGKEKYFSSKKMVDLCSGTGIIGLMLLDCEEKLLSCDGVEINSEAANLSLESAKLNGLDGRYNVICDNLKNLRAVLPDGRYDFVTCNPPYMSAESGRMCKTDYKTIARHEIECNLKDIFEIAFYLLKTGGSFYTVYRPDRLGYLFECAASARFEIKNMTFVYSNADKEPCLVLSEAKKQAKSGIIVSKPFIIYDKNGGYSQQMNVCTEDNIMEI